MIIIKSEREIELMKKAGEVVAKVFEIVGPKCLPGVSTMELSNMAEQIIRSEGAYPTFLGYGGFEGAICVSVNDTLVHGIPSEKIILKNGDIVSLDVGATLNGYVADACRTYLVGICSEEVKHLVKTTEESFWNALKLVKPGVHLGDISNAIQVYCEERGYSLPRDYTGHGIGTHLHEDPSIPNYGKKGTGVILKKGMCLAIEPMVAQGKLHVRVLSDGWTVKMKDGKMSAHYENTIAVTDSGYVVTTTFAHEKGVSN